MKTINHLCTVVLLAFLLVFYSATQCRAETIPQTQYQQLKSNNTLLITKLETLAMALETLKTPSSELVVQLAECRKDLDEANRLLATTQSELIVARKSLASAEALQKKTELSLTTLERQIAALKKSSKKGWQVAAIVGTILLIKCIHK